MNKTIFPQANNLGLIFQWISIFPREGVTLEQFSNNISYHEREGKYYLSAMEFIGAVDCVGEKYYLTEKGLSIASQSDPLVSLVYFLFLIFENTSIKEMYKKGKDFLLTEDKLNFYSKFIEVRFNLSHSTAHRRASCINSWFKWIDEKVIV